MTSLPRPVGIAVKAVIATLLVTALTLLVAPRVLGWQLQMVLSGSMAPTFDAGAVVAIRPISPDSVKPGDVVSFRRPEGSVVTHRVLEVRGNGAELVTKGDANDYADGLPMPASAVVGEVVADLPYLGYLTQFMREPLGFLLFIFMPGVALIIAELRSLARGRGVVAKDAVAT